ncbi:Imm44 family immunity protein [Pseudomonas sp. MAFF 302046]|jgi:hypothetical protein|uniref:Imm44 family immunity protein n=1 Tax=Pseudomonas morbosilactucae TaxID=2938197 RepID=A0ABT0JR93_9PSED|nr:Imm44 family immunity protein [Pseudomonas morbosilactucae]MCK9818259.1 Imm44 family immunity protein [Pseudomonas morbosilactucae]
MKFSMSGEIDADIGKGEHVARNKILPILSELVDRLSLEIELERWSFISIILSDKFISDYPEVFRFHKKSKVLEFRLQIDHDEFKHANEQLQISMMLDSIERSVGLMSKFKVIESDRALLLDAVNKARGELLVSQAD